MENKTLNLRFVLSTPKMVQSEHFIYLLQWSDGVVLENEYKKYTRKALCQKSRWSNSMYQELTNIVIHRYITGIYFLQDNTWKENLVFYIKMSIVVSLIQGSYLVWHLLIMTQYQCRLNISNRMT